MQTARETTVIQRTALTLFLLLAGAITRAAMAAEPIPNVGPAGDIVKVATDFGFTEGPAWDGNDSLYFSDVENARIHKLGADGKVTVFAENAGPPNGLMFNQGGELVACDMGGRIVAWNVATKAQRVVAAEYDGKRFNAPNDLVIDAAGGVYFTDPPFRAPTPQPQPGQGVYYAAPDGKVTRVVDDLPAPNGVLLSIDEKTLYVLPSRTSAMQAYPVEAPGKLGAATVFCRVKNADGGDTGGCDGGTIDERGNIYLSTGLGLQVFNAKGEALGVVELPEQPSNCTFGGADGKTLYVTARKSLYAVPMLVKGHWYAKASDGAIRIRAGATTPFTDSKGNVWLPEEGFVGGETITRPGDPEIKDTDDDALYRSEHYTMNSFSRALPNGKYTVKLHFAETYDEITGPGQRVFSFTVNGQEFKDFDVYQKAGGALRPYVESVDVEVTDGKLTITFTPKVQNAEINAIEIIPAGK